LRAASVVGAGASIPIAVGSLLLDRAVGLSTLAALGAAAGATVTGTSNQVVVALLGCIPVGFVVGLIVLRSRVVRASPLLRAGFLGRSVKPIVEYLSADGAPRAVMGSAVLSLLVSAATLGINRGIIAAIGAHPTSEKWVYVGLTLVFCTAVLPTLPGGWGTSDAATIYFLGLAGLPASSALAVCLLYRLFWYLSAAIGALLLLVRPVATAAAPTVDTSLQAADPPP
jgi:lysylphosphatidylglycerol synthase-like protein